MINIINLSKFYTTGSDQKAAILNLNFRIKEKEFLVIFGPNGCGKTTFLSILAGLLKQNGGQIVFSKEGLRLSYIFQNYKDTLFPWLNITDNIAWPLTLKGVEKKLRYKKVRKLCDEFKIKLDFSLYPYELSGGQQQLVAILRSFITEPHIILMDEPFSALDYQTSLSIMKKILEIWHKTKTTIIFVSHNIDTAVFLADRVVLFSKKPAQIAEIFENTLPRERDIEIMGTPEFANLKGRVLNAFKKEIINY